MRDRERAEHEQRLAETVARAAAEERAAHERRAEQLEREAEKLGDDSPNSRRPKHVGRSTWNAPGWRPWRRSCLRCNNPHDPSRQRANRSPDKGAVNPTRLRLARPSRCRPPTSQVRGRPILWPITANLDRTVLRIVHRPWWISPRHHRHHRRFSEPEMVPRPDRPSGRNPTVGSAMRRVSTTPASAEPRDPLEPVDGASTPAGQRSHALPALVGGIVIVGVFAAAAAVLRSPGDDGDGSTTAPTSFTAPAGGVTPSIAGGAIGAGGGGDCVVGVSWNNYQAERWAKWDEPALKAAIEAGGGSYISNDAKASAETQTSNVENLISQGEGACDPRPGRHGHQGIRQPRGVQRCASHRIRPRHRRSDRALHDVRQRRGRPHAGP